jgi:hypothetical protein
MHYTFRSQTQEKDTLDEVTVVVLELDVAGAAIAERGRRTAVVRAKNFILLGLTGG